jgi:hypothetical protein
MLIAMPPATSIKIVFVCSASIGHVRDVTDVKVRIYCIILQAPPLYNADEESLFWIVSNIYSETIDSSLEMVVKVANNFRDEHSGS